MFSSLELEQLKSKIDNKHYLKFLIDFRTTIQKSNPQYSTACIFSLVFLSKTTHFFVHIAVSVRQINDHS